MLQIPLTGTLTLGWFGLPKLGIVGPAGVGGDLLLPVAASGCCRGWSAATRRCACTGRRTASDWRFFRDILKVGLIACLVVILTNGTVLMVTGLIGRAGDAAIAGYGIGSRLEYMLVPISFGIGAALTALVGTNIGAGQYARARRIAWIGAFMAGGIAAAIGIVVAIAPDLWLGLFTRHPGALASGRIYLHIVGPVYGFFGLAMALYFASQGTGEMIWPVVANLTRIVIAVCGSLLALDVLGWGLPGLFAFVALGIVSFAAVLAFSTTRPAWRAEPRGNDMTTGLQLRSLIKKSGELELSLAKVDGARARPRPGRGQGRGDADQPVRPRPAARARRHGDGHGHRAAATAPSVTAKVLAGRAAHPRRAARPVDAGRQRGRGHGGQGGLVRRPRRRCWARPCR